MLFRQMDSARRSARSAITSQTLQREPSRSAPAEHWPPNLRTLRSKSGLIDGHKGTKCIATIACLRRAFSYFATALTVVSAVSATLNASQARTPSLMLKRQQMGEQMFHPAQVETAIRMLTSAHSDRPVSTWELLRSVVSDSAKSLDQRLEQSGRLEPERFSLKEANQRVAKLLESRRFA